MGRWLGKNLALLVCLGLLAIGLAAWSPWALEQLQPRQRYRVAWAALDCPAPPGLNQSDFLDEVQYLAELPDQLELLDCHLPTRLAKAFAVHPWVERVEKVEVTPPRHIQVRLTFRTPALAVSVAGKLLVVDGQGILLPRSAPTVGLARYGKVAPPPVGPVGTPWGDTDVETAARQAAGRLGGLPEH